MNLYRYYTKMSREISWEEIEEHHGDAETVWTVIHDKVYDMTKFLDDTWCADRDIIEYQPLNTWWAQEKVSSLDISAPLSILPTVTVEQAIDIMDKEGFDQLPVITESGKIVGVATMGSLKAKLLKVPSLPNVCPEI